MPKSDAATQVFIENTGNDPIPVTGNINVAVTSSSEVEVKNDSGNPVPVSQATAANLNAQVVGDVAHDSADSGPPVKVGARASDTAPTDVTANDRVNLWAKLNGALAQYMAYSLNPTDDAILSLPASTVISTTPTISASPDYSDGDAVGGIQTLATANYASGRSVVLDSLVVRDKSGQAPALDFYFFKATPSGGTYTDNAAVVWGAGDAANMVGMVSIAATADWRTVAGVSISAFGEIGQEMIVSGTSLFVLIVARGAWNAASASDLIFDTGLKRL